MLDSSRIREYVKSFNFTKLFIEELGWDRHSNRLDVPIDGEVFTLTAVAQKKGMVAFSCEPRADGQIPDHATRRKIERQVAKSVHEHLIVYLDKDRTTQTWQWVKREPGKPTACREHTFHRSQDGEALVQKLQGIAFSLAEEESLTISDVTRRARKAFDVERVTKRFYDEFRKQHAAFLKFISGIPVKDDHEWYASVMLNRLMFIYFIQRKGFLDGDHDYLRNRLNRTKREHGKDKFYSFYRYFLLRLFHEGLGGRARNAELDKLLGHIPYLNGGLFDVHELEKPERYGKAIQIPDKAFEAVFDYFDRWQWHLDERPLRNDTEINPGVLGFIFEKYINQKQMGAYYTEEDITDYISKNTVIPFLFDAARAKCKIAFENPKGPTIWDLLKENPDQYIYPAIRHGVSWNYDPQHRNKGEPLQAPRPLPPDIDAGIKNISKRTNWNKSAAAEFALPTEIWREVVARRQRYEELRSKLAGGDVRDINDLITLNVNIRQFAQDVIENCEGPDLLRALWHAIVHVTILDPTCGSGAFLFAALNILEPLYEACLDRMEAFVEDLERSGDKHRPEKFSDFRQVLESVAAHRNRSYFIFKTIILNNLFGVDIMEEAVEICKLRLFLKLAAQVEPDASKDNIGIEPLPDIDFNIRAGNTLVGYATQAELEKVAAGDLLLREEVKGVIEAAGDAASLYQCFLKAQTEGDQSPAEFKRQLKEKFAEVRLKCDAFLAETYELGMAKKPKKLSEWKTSHQPFHWFVEFYDIMHHGGFDVIIGNPPYVELNALKAYKIRNYACEESGNLYALIMERCNALGQESARQGYIVPVSSVSTDRYVTLQSLLLKREDWFSSYDDRPSRLFSGLEHIRLSIHIIGRHVRLPRLCSTRYNKWMSDERPNLFSLLWFTTSRLALVERTLPKLYSATERAIIEKLQSQQRKLSAFYRSAGPNNIFYSRKVGYFLQVLNFEPRVLDGKGRRRRPSEFKELRFENEIQSLLALCCLNSSLFYWFVTVFSDCRHVNKREVDAFPINLDELSASPLSKTLFKLAKGLMVDLQRHSENRTMRFQHDTLTVQCIYPKSSKPIIDEIDRVLAAHYGFTDEELDFIINYDIKYRMGRDAEADDE